MIALIVKVRFIYFLDKKTGLRSDEVENILLAKVELQFQEKLVILEGYIRFSYANSEKILALQKIKEYSEKKTAKLNKM